VTDPRSLVEPLLTLAFPGDVERTPGGYSEPGLHVRHLEVVYVDNSGADLQEAYDEAAARVRASMLDIAESFSAAWGPSEDLTFEVAWDDLVSQAISVRSSSTQRIVTHTEDEWLTIDRAVWRVAQGGASTAVRWAVNDRRVTLFSEWQDRDLPITIEAVVSTPLPTDDLP